MHHDSRGLEAAAEIGGSPSGLTSEEWSSLLARVCAHDLPGIDSSIFQGWFHSFSVYGFGAVDAGSNIARVDRTRRHAGLDGVEGYTVIFQLKGRSAVDHDGSLVELATGDLVLVDATRPMTVFNEERGVHHMALHMPRQRVVSHLGFKPKVPLHRGGIAPSRLLVKLMSDAFREPDQGITTPEPRMQIVVYDLLAALFAGTEHWMISSYTDKLFARIRTMIEARYADPELTPAAVAREARISPRYLQKLFSARGMTCGNFIHTLRLEHASRFLQRRALSQSDMPLSEIAFAAGFTDYTHFSRRFRERFGHPPSAHSVAEVRI
jgi:AraC family transcriptional regulator, positive regulator of tynA and feaB